MICKIERLTVNFRKKPELIEMIVNDQKIIYKTLQMSTLVILRFFRKNNSLDRKVIDKIWKINELAEMIGTNDQRIVDKSLQMNILSKRRFFRRNDSWDRRIIDKIRQMKRLNTLL